jgi:maleate isomerase
MAQPDNWGWKARIGMFIVASEAVPAAEWWAMMPPGVSVHAARVKAPTPWARWSQDRTTVDLEEDIARGARQFAAMRLDAVVTGHSSSSIAGGKGWDEAVVKRLSAELAPGTAATTNGLDCKAALEAMRIKNPFLVFPAWFGAATIEKGVGYFTDQGFAVAGRLQFDPGPYWREIPTEQHYPKGLGFEQDVEALYRQIRAACPGAADGVLIAGTGVRCVAIIDDLERDLGRPVITANQASLWNCLRLSGVRASVTGYGRLLEG